MNEECARLHFVAVYGTAFCQQKGGKGVEQHSYNIAWYIKKSYSSYQGAPASRWSQRHHQTRVRGSKLYYQIAWNWSYQWYPAHQQKKRKQKLRSNLRIPRVFISPSEYRHISYILSTAGGVQLPLVRRRLISLHSNKDRTSSILLTLPFVDSVGAGQKDWFLYHFFSACSTYVFNKEACENQRPIDPFLICEHSSPHRRLSEGSISCGALHHPPPQVIAGPFWENCVPLRRRWGGRRSLDSRRKCGLTESKTLELE